MSAQRRDDHDDLEAVVLAWLAQIYDNIDDGWLTLFSRTTDGHTHTNWAPVDDYDTFTTHALTRAATSDTWWGVATRTRKLGGGLRGGAEDCAYLPALWIDIDIAGPGHKTDKPLPPDEAAARAILAGYPLPPTAIVNSGGGLQAWWVLDEPLPATDARPILERWGHTWQKIGAEAGFHVDNVFDIARIMRLPGTTNRKLPDQPRPVWLTENHPDRRYGLDDLDQHLTEPPPSGAKVLTRPEWNGPPRPGDAFNEAHTTSEVLAAAGWAHVRTDRNGDEQWVRPGKDARQGTSATVYGSEDGHVTVWTDAIPGVDTRRPYDAYGIYTVLNHAGDYTASSDHLEGQGYGTKRRPDDLSWVHVSTNGAEQGENGGVDKAITPAAVLPDEFWHARPALEHIRCAAHSRQRSADALFHIVLARIASQIPHTLTIPGIVGTAASLSYFAATISSPGIGKSTANGIAEELLPAPEWVLDQMPPGSGEGMAEMFFEMVEDIDADGKTIKVKRQVKHNAFVYADEGQAVTEMGGRKGATLLPTLRSIWTGGSLGQTNARIETHRVVPALSYVLGLNLSLQGSKASALLDDADGGTPQRFGWACAFDPTVPDIEDQPEWPGPLDWAPPPTIHNVRLGIAPEIVREVKLADLARVRGDVVVDALDAHGDLYQLKVAGLLAVLDKRDHVNLEDWALAATVRACSNQVRAGVIATVMADAASKEQEATDRHVRREVAADAAVRSRRVVDCARKIAHRVKDRPGLSPGKHRALMRVWRDVFDDGLDVALAEGWVRERTEAGQGTEKRVLEYVKGPS